MLLVSLIGGVIYVFNNSDDIANQIVRNELIEKYNENGSSQYLISVGKIKLNIFTGSFSLQDINVVPKDSLIVLERNIENKSLSSTSFKLSISKIALSGFDVFNALNNQVIAAEKFELIKPHLDIYQHQGVSKESEIKQDTVDLRTIFLDSYDSINMGEISLKNITSAVHTIDSTNDTTTLFTVHNLSYRMFGIYANKETLFSNELINVDRYILNSKDIQVKLQDGGLLKVAALHLDSEDDNLIIDDFNFDPNVKPKEFLNKLKYRKAWVSFKSKRISISAINVVTWFQKREFHAQNLEITNPVLNIHSKDNIPFDPKEVKPMLGEMILGIPLPILISHASIVNAQINLDITGKSSPVHGKLEFHNMDVQISNITNIPSVIDTNSFLNIAAYTRLNQTGDINTKIKVDLKSQNSKTSFTVDATNIEFRNFNSVLKPILKVSITDGRMVDLKINSTISNNGAFGTMDAHYTGLKLQLESKDLSKDPGFFNKIGSGLANEVIKTDNIPGHQYYRQGKFSFNKTQHDNFFKMLWLVTMKGLTDSIFGSDYKDQKKQQKKENGNRNKKKLFNF